MRETFRNMKRVLKISNENRKYFVPILIFSAVQLIIGIFLPLFTARQIVAFSENIFEELVLVSLMVFGISLLNEFNNFVMRVVCKKFRLGTIRNLQMNLCEEILNLHEKDFQEKGTGTFIERITHDTDQMAEMFTQGIGYVSKTFMSAGIFIAIFIINKFVFVFYFTAAFILTVIHLIKVKTKGKKDILYRKQRDKVSSSITELVRGEKELKMLSAKNSYLQRLFLEIRLKSEKDYDKRFTDVLYLLIVKSLSHFFVFCLVLLLIYLIKEQNLSVSLAVALFTYKTNIMTNFMDNISLLLDEVKNFNISCNRVFAIFDNEEFLQENFGDGILKKVKGNFEFKNVTFGYNESAVLKNMSFHIQNGETVAFVGKSGMGKSTIFNLLGKLYTVWDGNIFIDGVDINTLSEDSIRGNMTIISQNPYVFNMSIKDNFKLVKEDISDKEIIKALKQACLYDFVQSLPQKLDTVIGEGGTNLSGGQKQRLAIARALVQNTKIILFDEATSALDNETQQHIQTAIDHLKGKYTVLIIAHRLSTIKTADRILLVDDGVICAEGTHEELLKNNLFYKKLYENEMINEE